MNGSPDVAVAMNCCVVSESLMDFPTTRLVVTYLAGRRLSDQTPRSSNVARSYHLAPERGWLFEPK